MPAKKQQFDDAALRADFENGMSINAIAQKHGSTWATVRKRLEELGVLAGKGKPASGRKATFAWIPALSSGARPAGAVILDYSRVMEDLRERQASLARAIEAIKLLVK